MAEAGWYPDPYGAPTWRYFDGFQWTHHCAPYQAPQTDTKTAARSTPSSAALRLDKTPSYCRVRVVELGQLDTTSEDAELVGATVVTWTGMEESDDVFAEVEIRGVVTADGELWWLSGDARVEVLEWPRYAGQPEDFIAAAPAMKVPAGVNGRRLGGMTVDTPEGWPELIWKNSGLYSAIRGWRDPELSVEEILCALAVAPADDSVREMLLAGLKARFARVVNDPRTYPPEGFPWRRRAAPSKDSLLP